MNTCLKLVACSALVALSIQAFAQSEPDDVEALQIAAVEALITAPPDRALPLARKVVEGNYSDELKERALFVLSQINRPEAQQLILSLARDSSGELQEEAIRMIGISGKPEILSQLRTFYLEGDEDIRDAVLEAYIIADDEESVYQLALETQDEETFAELVETLGIMGARDKLAQLRDKVDLSGSEASEALIEAYAISGDLESLRVLAMDPGDPERQLKAIEGIGIVGSKSADAALVEIYRSSDNEEVREAAVEGLMISGNDEAILELYRASDNPTEKRMLLEYMATMGSDAIWEAIDQALDGGE
jgi:HEAT repeat protein